MSATTQRPSAATPDPRSAKFAVMVAADALAEARATGDHEVGDRVEADLHAAARRMIAASPALAAFFARARIGTGTTPETTNPLAG